MIQWFYKRKSTISLSIAIALILSISVSGINYVSANPATTEDESEITSEHIQQIQTASQPPVRLVEDFSGGNVTASFIKASGELKTASRPEPVISGSQSAKLSYNLVSKETGTAAAYINFLDPGTSNFRTLEGKPTKLGLWVYGDGNNKHWLRAEFNTTADVSDFTGTAGFDWKGWKYVTINIPARLTKADFTDPVKLRRIYFVQTNELNKTAGTAYFDRVSVFYGDTGGLYGLDLLGLTPLKAGTEATAQVFETREGYTAPKKVTEGVSYTSSNESVAVINELGKVMALAEGSTTITASLGAFNTTYELVVSAGEPIVKQLYFTGTNELRMNETAQTDLFASFENIPEPIQILEGAAYTSDNEQIASIDENGFVQARATGKTNLRAAYGNQTATFELGVELPIPILQSIALTGVTPIEIGQSQQAKVIATYNSEPLTVELQNGVTFTSSNPSVATVDNKGLIQGVSLGISLITAKFEGKSAVYTVVVNKQGLQPPKRELRAAWISTVENIDWPKTKDPVQQQKDYVDLLDMHKSIGMNAVVMQVKPTADAFYKSELAPWSHWITGVQGQDPGYDPLAFMVEEAHKRNLEFHAWFNPYRISMNTDITKLVADHPARLHPEWVMEFGGKLYYNPGIPEVIQYITDSVMEVVKNYDVDAVHFDDYFYPNRFDGAGFPDQAAYEKYGADYPGDINAWRRHNVDTLIQKLSEAIKAEKSYVKFGISPFGVWRNKDVDPNGSDTNAGQPSYDNLHADIRKWILEGWIDYVVPQVYWNFGFAPAAYEKLVAWWSDLFEKNDVDAHLYIGHADYKVNENANFVDPYEIPNQMKFNLNYEQVKGSVHFTTRDLIAKPLLTQMIKDMYKYPALIPSMPWLDAKAPEKPSLTKAASHTNGIELNWSDTDSSTSYYVIYRAVGDQALNTEDPSQITATLRKGSEPLSFIDKGVTLGETYTYAIAAVDRLHNESQISSAMTITAEVVPDPLLVTEAAALSDISVVYGTKLADLTLPQTTAITLSDGTKPSVKVTWNAGVPAYDGLTAGMYVFSGQLELPAGVVNTNNIGATVNVIVNAEVVTDPLLVTEAAALSDISVVYGTKLADLTLPQTVAITLSDGTKPSVKVTWNAGVPTYDGLTAGKYVFSGQLELPEGVVNTNGIGATVNVIVNAEVVTDPLLVTEAAALSDISVVYGTKLADLTLPQTVAITLSDGTKPSVKVTWNAGVPAYDGLTAGKYVFSGQLELPAGVVNTNNIGATVNVIVQASTGGGNGGGTIIVPPTTSTDLTLGAGRSGTAALGEDISVYIPEGATNQELRLSIEKWTNTTNLPQQAGLELASSVFEILKNFTSNFNKAVTITIKYDSSKIGENQKPVLYYLDEALQKWVAIGGTAKDGKLTAQVDHFTKFAVFAIDSKTAACVNVLITDIKGHWAEKQITEAVQNCLVNGYSDHTFLPDQSINREEFAVMLVNALQLNGDAGTKAFTDQNQISAWAKSAVSLAVREGIITGYEDGSFRPKAKISRAEITAMIVRALHLKEQSEVEAKFADDASIPSWAKSFVSIAVEHGIIQGRTGNQFAPNDSATRAESVVMLLRMLNIPN